MNLKQKQLEFEAQFTVAINYMPGCGFYSDIDDEDGSDVWLQQDYGETREDALAAAENELNRMFNEWLDSQEEKDDLPLSSDQQAREYGVKYDRT